MRSPRSVPLEELAGPATLARHELGAEQLRLAPGVAEGFSAEEIAEFRAALIRNQQRRACSRPSPAP